MNHSPDTPSAQLPDQRQLLEVFEYLIPHVRTTPLMESDRLGKLIDGEVLIKPESLQKTGAFKFRGAFYRLGTLNNQHKKQGVIAYSSGNFAQGLATAGNLLNIPVTLVMPCDAPRNKINNAKRQNARVILCQKNQPSREEAASQLARELAFQNQQLLLHPFDDPLIIAGQASVALELEQQLQKAQYSASHILCPVGGGSLVAGSSLVFNSDSQVWAVEAEGYQGMHLSLTAGKKCRASGNIPSTCDALQALEPGKANLEVVLRTGVKSLVVSDDYVKDALKLAFEELKLVLEPSGAIALAAILQHPYQFRGKTIVAIATGGNVDRGTFCQLISDNKTVET